MERLTIKPKATDGIVSLVATDEPCVDICANMDGECGKCPINEAYKRLAAYEDTGKTPEEVAALVRAREYDVCELCAYNPPSSCDGKPCTMCPATPREAAEAALAAQEEK